MKVKYVMVILANGDFAFVRSGTPEFDAVAAIFEPEKSA